MAMFRCIGGSNKENMIEFNNIAFNGDDYYLFNPIKLFSRAFTNVDWEIIVNAETTQEDNSNHGILGIGVSGYSAIELMTTNTDGLFKFYNRNIGNTTGSTELGYLNNKDIKLTKRNGVLTITSDGIELFNGNFSPTSSNKGLTFGAYEGNSWQYFIGNVNKFTYNILT